MHGGDDGEPRRELRPGEAGARVVEEVHLGGPRDPRLGDRAERLLEDLGRGEVHITPEARRVLTNRHWHGNVRELKNTLACAIAFLDDSALEARHLAVPSSCEANTQSSIEPLSLGGLKLACIERMAIEQTLQLTVGNKARAAELLGIAPSTLYEKLKRYQKALAG